MVPNKYAYVKRPEKNTVSFFFPVSFFFRVSFFFFRLLDFSVPFVKKRGMPHSPKYPLIRNVGQSLAAPAGATDVLLVHDGDYSFHHYSCDGFGDVGWGCGYRVLQTICSWIDEDCPAPSIEEMIAILDGAEEQSGTTEACWNATKSKTPWIGTYEAFLIVDHEYDVGALRFLNFHRRGSLEGSKEYDMLCVDHTYVGSIDWLVDWLCRGSDDWLIDGLIDWLIVSLICWLILDFFIHFLIGTVPDFAHEIAGWPSWSFQQHWEALSVIWCSYLPRCIALYLRFDFSAEHIL